MQGAIPDAPRWGEILEVFRSRVNQQQFNTWFSRLTPLSITEELARLAVPNIFSRDWLNNYYLPVIREGIKAVLGTEPAVEIAVVESAEVVPTTPDRAGEPPPPAPPATASFAPDQSGLRRNPRYPNFVSDVVLNDHYVFDAFVVGPSNKLPHAASLAVAEQPALAYNPLFLHGSVGLGKTHLLQAICRTLLERRKDMKILYLSCEFFVNHFISAVKGGDLREFRNRYRRADMLLIDDINFLARKEQTQEEFFHTFNALYSSGKQIVLSSDSPPKDIPTLEERLVSRFRWGLVAEIEPPDFETRILIVKRKSRLRGHEFADDICEFVAERFTGNIRELEGAVLKIFSVADLLKKAPDLGVARDALRPLLSAGRRKITVDRIIAEVTRYYEVRQADLQSRRRSKSIAFPRQVGMYLARRLTDHSLEEIGGYFGGRDHTTVIYATEKINRLWNRDRKFKEELEALIREIEG